MISLVLSVAISIAAFAVLLALIVFIHEYGHFKVARLCGVRVDTFSIGFGPAFLKWTDKQGTVWKIASIPLGGYVKFFGDANAASAGASSHDTEEEHHEGRPLTTQFNSEKDKLAAYLTEEEKKVCFHFKPVWQRMAVVAAGPIANFILGAIIFAGLFLAFGIAAREPVIGYVMPESAAAEAGFVAGDRIETMNGRQIRYFNDLRTRIQLSSGDELRFEIIRNGQEMDLVAVPQRVTSEDPFGNEVRAGQLGVEPYTAPIIGAVGRDSPAQLAGIEIGDEIMAIDDQPIFTFGDIYRVIEGRGGEALPVKLLRNRQERILSVEIVTIEDTDEQGVTTRYDTIGLLPEQTQLIRLSPIESLFAGTVQVGRVIDSTLTVLARLVTFREDPTQLGGPVKIAKYAGQAAQAGFDPDFGQIALGDRILISLQYFINLAALISVSIGFMNLLPIPVLDGGHLVYYAYEAIAGRPLSDKVQGIGFRIGLAIVGSFMIFVLVNDVVGLF